MKTIEPKKLLELGLGTDQDCRLLDLGCGRGRHSRAVALELGIHTVGMDVEEAELKLARTAHAQMVADSWIDQDLSTYVYGSAYDIPAKDESFDAVICSEVLEHLVHYPLAIEQMMRVLKPGGVLGISVPNAFPEKINWFLSEEYHRAEGGHIRIFHAFSLRKEIEHVGFNFESQNLAHGLHSPYWWLRCLYGERRAQESSLVRGYQRFLEWDIMENPPLTRGMDWVLSPVVGKSIVMYFTKPLTVSDPSLTPV